MPTSRSRATFASHRPTYSFPRRPTERFASPLPSSFVDGGRMTTSRRLCWTEMWWSEPAPATKKRSQIRRHHRRRCWSSTPLQLARPRPRRCESSTSSSIPSASRRQRGSRRAAVAPSNRPGVASALSRSGGARRTTTLSRPHSAASESTWSLGSSGACCREITAR
jgi:hypothetical protein